MTWVDQLYFRMYIPKFLCELLSPFPLQANSLFSKKKKKELASFTNSLLILLEPNEPKVDFDLLYSKALAHPFEVCSGD